MEILPVPLPTLAGLGEEAQQQLQAQHTLTLALPPTTAASVLSREYGKLGQLLLTYDFLEAADSSLQNAGALSPEDMRWPYYLGVLYRRRGDFEAAAMHFERVLAKRPEDVIARIRLAEVWVELSRGEEARAELGRVLQEDEQNAFVRYLLGQLTYEAQDYEAAAGHYEAVLVLQPAATQVHVPLGLAYRNLGNEEQSQYYLDRRGSGQVQLRDPRIQAIEALKQSAGATALNQGLALMEQGRYQEAVAAIEIAVVQDSTNASGMLNLGVARSYAGDQVGAIRAFTEAIRLDPTLSKAHFNIGAILLANGQTAQAEEKFRAAVTYDPRNGNSQVELAELLRRDRRCREAVPHFEQALEITPSNVTARQHLALCHLRLGEHATARALLEAGHTANPTHLGFLDALARVLAASPQDAVRDGKRALQLAEEALTLRRRTETLETLAMAHAELGQYDDAITWQNEALRAAEPLNHTAYLTHLRQNLRAYEQRTPARTPWPDFMYEL